MIYFTNYKIWKDKYLIIDNFFDSHRNNKKTIHVIGDSLLDVYYQVSVSRLSPEFPGPIMQSEGEQCIYRGGGAANVVSCLRHFNVDAHLITFIDYVTIRKFQNLGILDHGLCEYLTRENYQSQVPQKIRFFNQNTQIHRWDIEKPNYGLTQQQHQTLEESLLKQYYSLPAPDIAILSDYNKGFFVDPQKWLQKLSCPTVVDPKKGPLQKWKGCTVFKPNTKEAKELSGLDDWRGQCLFFQKELGCTGVVITRSEDGPVGLDKDKFFEHVSPKISVKSCIGAGDCVAAILALSLAHGFPLCEAAELADKAGRIYVQGMYNRPITPAELGDKIVNPKDLKKRDYKLVFTNGVFDMLHSGHLATLRFAKNKGDKLVVAVNSDYSVTKLKGPNRPINSLQSRMDVLAAMDCVDFVVSFEEDDPENCIKMIMPDVLVKSGYKYENIVGIDTISEVYIAPYVEGVSTTNLLAKANYIAINREV